MGGGVVLVPLLSLFFKVDIRYAIGFGRKHRGFCTGGRVKGKMLFCIQVSAGAVSSVG